MLSHASKKHRRRLSYFGLACFFLLLTVIPAAAGQTDDTLPAAGGIRVSTDRPYYQPGESVSFAFTLDPAGRPLDGDLVLELFPAPSQSVTDPFSQEPLKEISVSEEFTVDEAVEAELSVSLDELDLPRGGYPVRVSLWQDGEAVLSGTSWLAVIDPEGREPVELVLLWTVGSPPSRNAQGEFFSSVLLERCQASPAAPDSLLQHQAIQRQFSGIRTSYAVEPALLDQLGDMADGFSLWEDGRLNEYGPGTPEALTAAACQQSLGSLASAANAEILGAPYAFGGLPLLAREGWDDGYGQYRVGQDVTARSLDLAATPEGAYVPGLDLTTDSLRYVAATGGEYAVLAGATRVSVQGRPDEEKTTWRLRDLSGERLTALFANDALSLALLGDEPDLPAFYAALANAHASESPGRLAIAAAPVTSPALTAAEREGVYASLEGQPWVQSLTLAEARQKYPPDTEPATLLRYYDPAEGYLEQSYYRRLAETHELFEDYRLAVDSDEPEAQRLVRKIYTAESYYLAGEDVSPEAANLGLEYLADVADFTRGQFAGLAVEVDTSFLQRSSSSELTVNITNSNPYPFNVELVVEGEGLDISDQPRRQLRLETGLTQVTLPYHADGWTDFRAEIRSRDHALAGADGSIRPITGRVWIVLAAVVAAAIAAIGYMYLVVRRR